MLHCDVPCLLHRIHYCELSYFNLSKSNQYNIICGEHLLLSDFSQYSSMYIWLYQNYIEIICTITIRFFFFFDK